MNAAQLLAHFDRISEAPDAIPRLRRFILDLAVRGKLVEQDLNDEPAGELLRRIQEEKARLVKKGEIRKDKLLPSLEVDEILYSIPVGWKWAPIRQVTSDRGQTIPTKDFTYIDVTAINKEIGYIADAKILTAINAPSRARKLVKKGDVIYSCVRPYLLNIAIIDSDIIPEPIASTAFAILNGFGLTLPKYLWIVLRSPFMIECVEAKMRGQAYPAINDSDFALLPFPLPPLAEQHRIIAKVDELMALCDQLEAAKAERESHRDRLISASLHRLNSSANADASREHARFYLNHLPRLTTRPEHIKQLRQAILNLAVRGRLVPQDPNDEPAAELLKRIEAEKTKLFKAGEIKKSNTTIRSPNKISNLFLCKGWSITSLETICTSITDGDHIPPPKANDGIPFLVIGNVRTQVINFTDTRFVPLEYYEALDPIRRPRSGDLLYTLVGSYGIPIIVCDDQPFCVQRHIGILRASRLIDIGFLAYTMASQWILDQATSCATGIAQKTIPLSGLRQFIIPIPPLPEQHRIVAKVDELMALCDQLEAQLTSTQANSRRLLEAMLQRALGEHI